MHLKCIKQHLYTACSVKLYACVNRLIWQILTFWITWVVHFSWSSSLCIFRCICRCILYTWMSYYCRVTWLGEVFCAMWEDAINQLTNLLSNNILLILSISFCSPNQNSSEWMGGLKPGLGSHTVEEHAFIGMVVVLLRNLLSAMGVSLPQLLVAHLLDLTKKKINHFFFYMNLD